MRCSVTNMRMPIERWVDITVYEFITKFSTFADDIYFGYFPPLDLLNHYTNLGEQNEGMGNNAVWYPFSLTQSGYDELIDNINRNKEKPLLLFDNTPILSLESWRHIMIQQHRNNDFFGQKNYRNPIKFYHPREAYGEFTNFSNHGILMDNLWWKTIEHYYQAQKFTDKDYQEKIMEADTPKIASVLGRNKKRKIKEDWDDIKDEVMYEAVLQKFTTHKELRDLLLSTGDKDIIENSPTDYYWGCGIDGWGKNMLGKILEQVRDELRSADSN
ncbi:NADAR family protein [Psychrobacter aquaticus]|uniref:NADAR domain-containing protein n=1 Tax=Psychrobacter aquaticus CMS 56 TaxID=1354303 RepID=U4T6U5_9GAMM|nr:NADAR family protein [Psychrobacter aquaticus]ERL55881.1 hypothetical protein M917_1223 [Psychrobacter aquaticus CMS 56]